MQVQNGYLISETPIKFEITYNIAYQTLPDGSTPVITIIKTDNAVKGKINIEKKGEVLTDYRDNKFIYEEKGLPGAKYEIFAKEDILDSSGDGTIIYKKGTVVDTVTTNNEGKATSKELPLGEFSIREIKAPNNMVINNEIKDVILSYKDQNTSIIFEDASFVNQRQKVDITVIKKDAEQNIGLKGAEFGLYAKNDIVNNEGNIIVNKGRLIETATSNEDGKVNFTSDLPLTKFEIKELKAAMGYASSNKVIEVDATYKGQEIDIIELEYEFENKITEIEVSKLDITTSEEIEGALLTIYEKDNPGAIFDTWISGSDGKNKDGTIKPHKIKGLEIGKTYVLKEVSSSYGFALAQDIEFSVKDTDEVQRVVMKDKLVYGELEFNKKGEIFNEVKTEQTEFGEIKKPIWNKSNLLGAEITIYASEDIKIGNTTYYKKDEKVETLESDWENVRSKKLPVGFYYYLETKVAHGYIIDTNKHYFEVKDNQKDELQLISSTLINNRPKFNIDMLKVLEKQEIFINNMAYKDIIFGIFAREDIYDYMGNVKIENGQMVAISEITEDGHLKNVPDLPNGVYYIKELATNSQYVLDDTEYDFEVSYHGEDVSFYEIKIGLEGVVDNKLARGTIKVQKLDTLYNEIKLPNIEFDISKDANMKNIIKTSKTNEDGIAIFEDLELGTYYIKESKKVDGYILNDYIYKVEVKTNGDILTIICENKPTELIFSKVDETGENELPGATIQIIDKETGQVVEEWISTNEPHIVHYLIEDKEYIMREKISPKGYEIAEEITFIAGDGFKITMKDKRIPRIQTGNETNYNLLFSLMGISIIGITTGIIAIKRNKKNKEVKSE